MGLFKSIVCIWNCA